MFAHKNVDFFHTIKSRLDILLREQALSALEVLGFNPVNLHSARIPAGILKHVAIQRWLGSLAAQVGSIVFLSFATPVFAQIGESWESVFEKLGDDIRGEPVKAAVFPETPPPYGSSQCVWVKDGWVVSMMWLPPDGYRGGADYAAYSRADLSKITDDMVKWVLTENSGGFEWLSPPRIPNGSSITETFPDVVTVKRSDGAAAKVTPSSVIITSPDFMRFFPSKHQSHTDEAKE